MEIKQLKYFVVAADVNSFSEAAKLLYTTQSSISKVIGALEGELGYPLFERESKGIKLTYEGRKFYDRASKLVSDFNSLESESVEDSRKQIHMGANPSSWLANCFSEFYDEQGNPDVCYCIHEDTTSNLVGRVRHMKDELCFVYVFPDSRLQFDYEIKKYGLTFEKLKSVSGMIYFQPDDEMERKEISVSNIHDLKFIQSEHDEYIRYGEWQTEDGVQVDIKNEIAVVTNSDYIMHSFLQKNSLANLSADSFNGYDTGVIPGIKLQNRRGEIEFGVIKNDAGQISAEAADFLAYIKQQLSTR